MRHTLSTASPASESSNISAFGALTSTSSVLSSRFRTPSSPPGTTVTLPSECTIGISGADARTLCAAESKERAVEEMRSSAPVAGFKRGIWKGSCAFGASVAFESAGRRVRSVRSKRVAALTGWMRRRQRVTERPDCDRRHRHARHADRRRRYLGEERHRSGSRVECSGSRRASSNYRYPLSRSTSREGRGRLVFIHGPLGWSEL